MIKAVLFDFDGTLMNTNDLIFESYGYAFRQVLGRDVTDEEIHNMYGKPLYSSLAKYGDKQDEIYRVYREYNEKNHDRLVKFFDGAAEGVRILHENGYKLAVVTSKREVTLKRGIKLLGLEDCFDVLITPADTDKHKPDPTPVLVACERLGVKPGESVMVGDSVFDLQCGKGAGTKLAAVTYSTTFDALKEYHPEYVVDTLAELADIIINEK